MCIIPITASGNFPTPRPEKRKNPMFKPFYINVYRILAFLTDFAIAEIIGDFGQVSRISRENTFLVSTYGRNEK
jgi:hypothetical protein